MSDDLEKGVGGKVDDLEKPGEFLKQITNYQKIFSKSKGDDGPSKDDSLMFYSLYGVVK